MMTAMREGNDQIARCDRSRLARSLAAAVLVVAVCAVSPSDAGPREERAICWESYRVCVQGAGTAEQWRTVCYSDYSSCMRNPGEISCRAEDRASCEAADRECAEQGDGSDVITNHCNQDNQVCLDAMGC